MKTAWKILLFNNIGSRRVTDENSVRIEEDAVLSDYLSKCEFNKGEYRMHLPDENIHEIPKGFECEFYREAKEKLFEVTLDGECFTVILWDEKGWDSDSSDERYVEQVKFVYAFEITCVSDNLIGQHSATSSKFTSSQASSFCSVLLKLIVCFF
jgi:hypothetical protein